MGQVNLPQEAPGCQTPESTLFSHQAVDTFIKSFYFTDHTTPQARLLGKKKKILHWVFCCHMTFHSYVTNFHKRKFSEPWGSHSAVRDRHHWGTPGGTTREGGHAASRTVQNGTASVARNLQTHPTVEIRCFLLKKTEATVENFNLTFKRQILIVNSLC